jgi:DNA polymerase type B, organellar and viral.
MKVNRRPHKLKANAGVEFPRNMLFFDIESRLLREGKIIRHIPYLYLGYWYYEEKGKRKDVVDQWRYFDNAADFWNWVCSRVFSKEALYMFAHNPSYDLIASAGIPILKAKGYRISRYYEKGRTFILTFKGEKKSIHILNVGNFYQGTVAQIGETLNLPKLELDYENPTIEEALPYCKRDVEIIAKAMLTWFKFCKDNDLGNFGKTAPKQAFNAYRHRFMKEKIYIHADEKANDLEREAYYGGRTEAFKLGKIRDSTVYVLDVNSMYPAVMKSYLYPYKLYAYRENLSTSGLRQVIKDYLVCAMVKIRTAVPSFPCRIKNRLIFPVGEFITALATPELEIAFSEGCVEEVYRVALYRAGRIFADYVDFFYNARLEAKAQGNRVNDMLFKLMLNSLYGKFGEKAGDWEVEGPTDYQGAGYERVFSLTTGKWTTYKWLGGVMLFKQEEKEGYDSFPGIAAHVTSYARRKLWEYIQQAGLDNVYYCDTDSLFVSQAGLENLNRFIDPERLGYLKMEKELHNLIIYGPKDYVSDKGEKHKGIPKSAVKIGNNTWKYTFWPKISTLIRHNSVDTYFNIDMEKTLKRQYMKGWVLENGKVVPFELAVESNNNRLVGWENTSYAHRGLKLALAEQEKWITQQFG